MKPIIGVTACRNEETKKIYKTNTSYVEAILQSGGIPMMLPAVGEVSYCQQIIQHLDGLLVPGGPDVAPSLYNEEPCPQVNYVRKDVDLFEVELIRLAKEHNKPILGICRGIQIINVTFGGSLYQDLASQYKNELCHRQNANITDEPTHRVYLEENSHIAEILKATVAEVNSYHHQAVRDVAEGFTITGRAKDGVIESIESQDGWIIGVQWHPELMTQRFQQSKGLFDAFVEQCRA